MKIDAVANHQFISQRTKNTGHTTGQTDASASFAAILSAQTTRGAPDSSKPKDVNQVDFTNMTRQEMHDWMNDQIPENMSFEESRPFLGMTFSASDMATDNTRINFIEKASRGIEWALSRNDQDMAAGLRMAIETMHRYQRQGISVDARA